MAGIKFQLVHMGKNSYPFIEADEPSDTFYIIKQGSVTLSNSLIPMGKNDSEVMGVGDFFGVISCMAQRPRLYSAYTLDDSLLIQVQRDQFDYLIQNNNPIAMKIIRYFSKQLRFFNGQLTRMSVQTIAEEEDPSMLYELGDYYISKKDCYVHAAHAYYKYLQFCARGQHRDMATQKLEAIRKNYKVNFLPRKEGYLYLFEDKQPIFLEHELGEELYIIQAGEVKISKIVNNQEVLLNILKVGDIFGEMAILENKPRNANALASGSVKLMAVSKENFGSIVEQHPEIASRIIRLLSSRIWFMHRHITNMMIQDPKTRLFDALYIHLLKERVDLERELFYTFQLSSEDLLKFTGLQTSAGYAALMEHIQKSKFFSVEDGKIHCKKLSHIIDNINVVQRKRDLKNSGM